MDHPVQKILTVCCQTEHSDVSTPMKVVIQSPCTLASAKMTPGRIFELTINNIIFLRWDESQSECLDSPGSSSDRNISREKYKPFQMKDEIENDSNGNDDIDLIVQKIFGPLGMIIVIMVIIGVCIVLHNKKYYRKNRNAKIKYF